VSGFAPRIVLGLTLVFNRQSNGRALGWSNPVQDTGFMVIVSREKPRK
jgi:hypothetical protein